ncbi:MAG: 7-carboxy-7-deazaguanine synthase QueE [Planctomycetales bacterium]
MNIAEIYHSIQGEGRLSGTPSVFVRTSGCNLRCWFCDTPYTSWAPEGVDLPVDGIMAQISEWDIDHIVLTGGEPMMFAELIPLAGDLSKAGKHITIETAGTLYLPVACDLMSISPKLSNSTPVRDAAWSRRHERARHRPGVIRQLMKEYDYQLKFVVASLTDCGEVHTYLEQFPEVDHRQVLLMPRGTDPEGLNEIGEWLKPYCEENGWRYCPRQHIAWYGLVRGT